MQTTLRQLFFLKRDVLGPDRVKMDISHIYKVFMNSDWDESKHPRNSDGKFGYGDAERKQDEKYIDNFDEDDSKTWGLSKDQRDRYEKANKFVESLTEGGPVDFHDESFYLPDIAEDKDLDISDDDRKILSSAYDEPSEWSKSKDPVIRGVGKSYDKMSPDDKARNEESLKKGVKDRVNSAIERVNESVGKQIQENLDIIHDFDNIKHDNLYQAESRIRRHEQRQMKESVKPLKKQAP